MTPAAVYEDFLRLEAESVIREFHSLERAIDAPRHEPEPRYVVVSVDLIPAGVKALAAMVARAAALDLGLAPPALTWMDGSTAERSTGKTYWGLAWPHEHRIALDYRLRGPDLIRTVRHEVAHIAGRDERGAMAFEDPRRSPR